MVHNVRSAHNVGAILRTADGLGVEKVYLTGYSPYPPEVVDQRLPHVSQRAGRQISKTALGAEENLDWRYHKSPMILLKQLAKQGYLILALEQTAHAEDMTKFKTKQPVVLIVGNEVGGLDEAILKIADKHLQIPMSGGKESFNVSVAAGMALYHLRYFS